MAIHEIKTDPIVFQQTLDGLKDFEIRFDDRGYQVGDILVLCETEYSSEEMKDGLPLVYTGYQMRRVVVSKVTGYGLEEGWCVMGTEKHKGM